MASRKILFLLFPLFFIFIIFNTVPDSQAHAELAPEIIVPIGSNLDFDGVCTQDEYGDAQTIELGTLAETVYLKRDDSYLYVCFRGLAGGNDSAAVLYLDRLHDGGQEARVDDYRLSITNSGVTGSSIGDNASGYTDTTLTGWQAMHNTFAFGFWSAEFRVHRNTFFDWGDEVGMAFGRSLGGDGRMWPETAVFNQPDTWTHALLRRPVIAAPNESAPVLDGDCNFTDEYQDAGKATFVNVFGQESTIYMKHNRDYLFVCVDNLQSNVEPPDAPVTSVSLYIDPDHSMSTVPQTDDFKLTVDVNGNKSGASGSITGFAGPDPGGWVVRVEPGEIGWSAEFRLHRRLVNGWGHTIGMTVGYEDVRADNDNYYWPAGSSSNRTNRWGDVELEVDSLTIPLAAAPNFNGTCGFNEYEDGVQVRFTSGLNQDVRVWSKHTENFLYVCFDGLPFGGPDNSNLAKLMIDRDLTRLAQPGAADYQFLVSRDGGILAGSGDGNGGFTGSDPGGWAVRQENQDFNWDAEFRIARTTVGGWDNIVGISFAHDMMLNDAGWPYGGVQTIPHAWGLAEFLEEPITNDLTVTAIEVTQAIQDLDNSVPLIANKPTVVRVHVQASEVNTPGVTARLYGRLNGTLIETGLYPLNPGGRITVLTNPDRGQINDSFYFRLPASWDQGTLQLEARINTDRALPETNLANNSDTTTVNFELGPNLYLHLINWRYQFDGDTHQADSFHISQMYMWLRRAYPISGISFSQRSYNYTDDFNDVDADVANSIAKTMRQLDLASGDLGDDRIIYYNMIDDGGRFIRGKAAGIPSSIATGPTGTMTFGWDEDGTYGDWMAGHELAHSLDRYHAEYCGAGGGSSYPYGGGDLGPDDGTFYGFNVGRMEVYSPHTYHDVMTYCRYQWVSDFTYEGLLDYLQDQSNLLRFETELADEYVAVFGRIDENETAVFDSMFRLTDVNAVPETLHGSSLIRLLDASGNTLHEHAFQPSEMHVGPPAPGETAGEEVETYLIHEFVPWHPETQEIVLVQDGQVKASRIVSANAPAVNAQWPNGGNLGNQSTIAFNWSASDADNDELTFAVQISRDGRQTWETLVVGLTESQYRLDNADLGGGQIHWRVLASDGVNTAVDEIQVPFFLPPKAPEPIIMSPADGDLFWVGQTAVLEGVAFDIEDGTVAENNLSWSSNIDGNLGTGNLAPAQLSPGTHRLTLLARDSHNRVRSASIVVTVLAEDAPMLSEMSVSPSGGNVVVGKGSAPVEVEITVRDRFGGIFDWTAVSDTPWLSFDTDNGIAPDSLIVTIDPAGMELGVYDGSLTIEAQQPGITNGSQTINLSLTIIEETDDFIFLPMIMKN